MVIDSNILIYAINADSPKHKAAQKFVKNNLSNLSVAHQNILEAVRVLTHKKFSNAMKTKEALSAVMTISDSSKVIFPDQKTIYITNELIQKHSLSGNRIFDAYLVATALSNDDYEIVTDNVKDFKKYKEVKTINPFKPQN